MAVLSPSSNSASSVRRLVLALVPLVVLTAVGGAIWINQQSQAKNLSETVVPAPLPPSGVGALGRLEPGWKIYQVAPASATDGARIETLSVEEGEEVSAGLILATLDMQARRQAALQEAEAQVLVANAKLIQVKAGTKPEEIAAQEAMIAKYRAALANATTSFQRAEELISRQVLSREDFDLRRMDLDTNRALLKQAEKTLAAMKHVRPEEVAVAEAEKVRAEAGMARAKADVEATKITSPISGRVLKINARVGEKISELGVLELGDTSKMHAVAEVYERDAPRVQVGQKAKVKIQSMPGELQGKVLAVGWRVGRKVVLDNDPIKDTDARIVEVRIELDATSSQKVARLSYARVEIYIDAPPLASGE